MGTIYSVSINVVPRITTNTGLLSSTIYKDELVQAHQDVSNNACNIQPSCHAIPIAASNTYVRGEFL